MTGETTSMLPGTIALVLGCVSAVLVATRIKFNKSDAQTDTPVLDLEEQVGHAVLMLRDLAHQRPRLDPTSYQEQKSRLEQEAAAALRARDERLETMRKPQVPESAGASEKLSLEFLRNRPQLKGFLWGALAMFMCFGLYFSVYTKATPRMEGGGMTGAQPGAASANSGSPQRGPAAAPNAEVQELLAKLKANPQDVDSMARLGRILLFQQLHHEAQMVTERALQIAPDHLGAQINQAMVTAGKGDAAGALTQLNTIIEQDEKSYDAWFFKGMLSMQNGDNEGMQKSFTQFVSLAPDSPRKDRIKKMLAGGAMQMPKQVSPRGAN